MAVSNTFRCPSCKNLTMALGEKQAIMSGEMHGVLCEDEQEVFDCDSTSEKCPNDPTHRARVWLEPWPCPKCGAPMTRGEPAMAYD